MDGDGMWEDEEGDDEDVVVRLAPEGSGRGFNGARAGGRWVWGGPGGARNPGDMEGMMMPPGVRLCVELRTMEG